VLGLDHLVAVARALVEAVSGCRCLSVQDDTGYIWRGKSHREWSVSGWTEVVEKGADLKDAYKLLPASPVDARFYIGTGGRQRGGLNASARMF
jgi:hypothetical protein